MKTSCNQSNTIDVSIIIPTFNRSRTLLSAIDSCRYHPGLNLEIIIIDDGSTDDTKEKLAEFFQTDELLKGYSAVFMESDYPTSNIKLLYFFKENGGSSDARNMGLEVATGRYIKFLDSDDKLIRGALSKEVQFAEKTAADVVVTGWKVIQVDIKTDKVIGHEVDIPAPNMDDGIDSMLKGIAPWTSAALYKSSSINDLRWDVSLEKADDWMWAWAVCLSDANFRQLNILSSIYIQYEGERDTTQGDPFIRSTLCRQQILRNVETSLYSSGRLNDVRKKALAQYYYKDSRVVCEMDRNDWKTLSKKILLLNPAFHPVESNRICAIFISIFGLYQGVCNFVSLRRATSTIIRIFRLKLRC